MKHFAGNRMAILVILVAALAASSCHKQAAQVPPPPTPAVAAAAPPAAPTVTLQASPNSITRGGSSTLTWSSSNATQLRLTPGGITLSAQGSQTVSPADSTTYTVTAIGPGGQATASATVNVSVPPPARAASVSLEQMFNQSVTDAYFDYDKADIRADAKQALTRDADFLRAHPEIRFTIEGHCDERGSEEYNLALGDRRAQATKNYLASLGISPDRMQTVSYGKERPFCTEHNESCYQQNRRGHLTMTAPGGVSVTRK